MDDLEIKLWELTENPSARVPVCLCLDISGSMDGEPIRQLNDALTRFFSEVMANKLARYSADICVVTFNDAARTVLDFGSVERQRVPPLRASGTTQMGHAVELALDMLDRRKLHYQTAGNDYYQPWLVLMTDGQPTDDIRAVAERTRKLVRDRKLTVFPIGIGVHADFATLSAFSAPGHAAMRLQELRFGEFFTWLSQSIVRVSATSVGDDVQMPPTKSWGDPF